jgi:AcrR family transcriptional regulator
VRRRRTLRREDLLDAADTVIRRVGTKTSAALIAKEAGVTKPIIYRHFGDLQDLYRALAIRHEDRLTAYLRSARELHRELDRRSRMRAVVSAFFGAVEREPNLFRFLVQSPTGEMRDEEGGPPWLTRRFAEQIGAYLGREFDETGSARSRALGYAVAASLITTASWWLEESTISRDEVIDAITDLLSGGTPAASEDGSEKPVGRPD